MLFLLCFLDFISIAFSKDIECGTSVICNLSDDGLILTVSGTGEMKDFSESDTREWKDTIKELRIEDGVTSIGDEAFSYCKELKTVVINESSNLNSIGRSSFQSCYKLTTFTIPKSVNSIGNYALAYCSSLKEIIVDPENNNYSSDTDGILYNKEKTKLIQYPLGNERTEYTISNSVTIIGSISFSFSKLITINIPKSVKTIEGEAFENCSKLTTLTFEYKSEITSIGDYAFFVCESLKSVNIPKSVETIGNYAFSQCTSLTSVTFSDNPSLNSIKDYAFKNCQSLTSISIPKSVTSIGSYSFEECSNLACVSYEGKGQLSTCGSYIFSNTKINDVNAIHVVSDFQENGDVCGYKVNRDNLKCPKCNIFNCGYCKNDNSNQCAKCLDGYTKNGNGEGKVDCLNNDIDGLLDCYSTNSATLIPGRGPVGGTEKCKYCNTQPGHEFCKNCVFVEDKNNGEIVIEGKKYTETCIDCSSEHYVEENGKCVVLDGIDPKVNGNCVSEMQGPISGTGKCMFCHTQKGYEFCKNCVFIEDNEKGDIDIEGKKYSETCFDCSTEHYKISNGKCVPINRAEEMYKKVKGWGIGAGIIELLDSIASIIGAAASLYYCLPIRKVKKEISDINKSKETQNN